MAASPDDNGGLITGINVTPLVDVVLVLLIIFMATAPLIARRAIAVNVPRAATGERATAALRDGDEVLVDAARGLVARLPR